MSELGQTMRAAVVTAHGDLSCIEIRDDHPLPRPEPQDVIVRVRATAVNFHDLFTRRGMPGIKIRLPVVTGSDIAGEIAAVGADVEGWSVGTRVLIDPIIREGSLFGMTGETTDGGRAEYVRVRAYQLIRLPSGVSMQDAAALPLAYGTAHRMLVTRARLARGEKVLVLGASGGVGVACVQIARQLGATVIACCSSEEKARRLRELGADHVVDYSRSDLRNAVVDIVGKPRVSGLGGGVDCAINFTGGSTWPETLRCVAKRGRILTCGATAGFDVTTDLRYVWSFELDIRGSDGWTRDDLDRLLELIARRELMPSVDRVLPLEQAREAEALLESRQVFGKLVLTP